MKRVIALFLFAAIAVGVFAGGNGEAGAEKKIVLKASDTHPIDYPTVLGVLKMGELLNEWTKGRITVEMYPSKQLGEEKETIEQTQLGAIDIVRVSVGPVGEIVPELNVLALPYVFRSEEHCYKVMDGPIGQELLKKVEAHGLIGLGWYGSGQRSFYNTKKPIKTLADLKGLKFRVMQNEVFVNMVNALGASATPMAYGEVYTALSTGVIDGAENNYPSFFTSNHYEVAQYYTQDEHLRVPEIILFSKKTWDKLSAEDQKLVLKAAAESVPYQRNEWTKMAAASYKQLEAAGVNIITEIDKQPFIDAMAPVYAAYPELLEWVKKIQAVK
ncbi:MAG: TRAP transporter substrate-binding protein [Spirochaetales bacterium]|nr:TRAP transporter substrate-binding protein [Spirochaetales bacterium]